MSHDELINLAEVYALGALEGSELGEYQAHLSTGCTDCRARLREANQALIGLPDDYQMLTPSAAVKTRIFEQIDRDKPGLSFIFADQGVWLEVAPGVRAKVLNMDSDRQRVTALVRMDPGSRYDNHRHTRTEELVVIEGSCYCGGKLLRKGDYHRAEAGSIHLDTFTDDGSLMLIITSMQNELLA